MFSASFLVSYAEGLPEADQQALYADLEAAGKALSDVSVIGVVLEPATQSPGNIMFEVGFPNQEAYEAAKATDAWTGLKDMLADTKRVSLYQFAAYGDDGVLKLTDTEKATCHRLLFTHVRDDADPDMVAHAYEVMPYMQDFVPGFVNSKISKVVESEGSQTWDYVFECDYADPSVYPGAYIMHPIHITYIDRFFEPACAQYVFTPDLCTSVIETDGPFLANYAE